MTKILRSPLFWILLMAAGLRMSGLFWGLPAPDGWDDDGFAPRNFLTALGLTYKHGSYFTYPPLHAFLLAVLSLPGVILALVNAPSFHQADVIGEFTKSGYMTFFTVVGRSVSLLMSLGIIWTVGEMARLMTGALGESRTAPFEARRAGLLAAGACALNFGLTYYGQVSNLDVPYLFWSLLALLWTMRAVVEQNPKHVWPAALLAAAAVATKDQAYGLFLLSLPVFLLLWFGSEAWPRANLRKIGVALFCAAAAALLLLLLIDGAITNSSGFAQRLAFLTGPASRDYAEYTQTPSGWLALLGDMMMDFTAGYGLVAVTLFVLGIAVHTARSRDGVRVAGLLPLLAILSFTLCFNLAALRSDARFILPQSVLACVYIGIAAEVLAFAAQSWMRLAARAALTVTAIFALHHAIAINAAFLFDPRYDAEKWMAAHVQPGDTIETYGQNAYLPRFPHQARVSRVGSGPLNRRNPLSGVTELRQPFDAPRAPRFIVVSEWWLRHYTDANSDMGGARQPSKKQQELFHDTAARAYFTALRAGGLKYRLVHLSGPVRGFWPQVHIHESLNEAICIFERKA